MKTLRGKQAVVTGADSLRDHRCLHEAAVAGNDRERGRGLIVGRPHWPTGQSPADKG